MRAAASSSSRGGRKGQLAGGRGQALCRALLVCALLAVSSLATVAAAAESPLVVSDRAALAEILQGAKGDAEFRKWMTELRRELHQKPELMYKEFETSKVVQRELAALGVPFTAGIGGTGVVGVIGSGEAPVVALRADMDALPLDEEAEVYFRSTHPGRMHACGHDVHTTMLLGAARLLTGLQAEGKLGRGTIKLAFQPAEEGGAGALHIREHLRDISAIFGFHVWPSVETGIVASRPGTIMASAVFFKCVFKGKGTHGAMPHLGRDPVVAASAAIVALQTLVSRTSSPFDSNVVSVTQFKAGEAFNVIPDETTIGGTMRTMTEKSMHELIEKATEMMRSVGKAYGCEAEVSWMEEDKPITPPVVNSKKAHAFASEVGKILLGNGNVVDTEPSMAAEDFSYYTQMVDGAFIFLGIRNESLGSVWPLHHPKFMADEEVLPIGAAYHTALALAALDGGPSGESAFAKKEKEEL